MHQLLSLVKGEKLTTDMILLVLACEVGIESSQIQSFEPQPPLGKLVQCCQSLGNLGIIENKFPSLAPLYRHMHVIQVFIGH